MDANVKCSQYLSIYGNNSSVSLHLKPNDILNVVIQLLPSMNLMNDFTEWNQVKNMQTGDKL